jgi:DNA-binding SARP family transcriptional activator
VWLLGRPHVEEDGRSRPVRGQKSWALLARIALSERPVARAEIAAELFALAEDPFGALRWHLADLRRCLGSAELLRGDPLTWPADAIWVDVRALYAGSLPMAELGGTLLDGVAVRRCPRFDTWLLLERAACAARSMEELRQAALRLLAVDDAQAATEPAGRAAALDPLDEGAQELFLRTLTAAGWADQAASHLARCQAVFAAEQIPLSSVVLLAARPVGDRPRIGVQAAASARSLLRAGTAALDAGQADAGVETLRRAAEEAECSGDRRLQGNVLRTLGSALVHAVRGFDGEGAVVLHRAMVIARQGDEPTLVADCLRELAFVDVQAGRHTSAKRALSEAAELAGIADDPALIAGISAVRGMNEGDRGHHMAASALLTESAGTATAAGRSRQAAWSHGVLSRSLLLGGDVASARTAAERSMAMCDREQWNAFRPWPQALLAHCLIEEGRIDDARHEAEEAFALACEIGDPCWEGLAARALAVAALRDGDTGTAGAWIVDARRRCNRVSDRYVWLSAYIELAHLEIAAATDRTLVGPLAARLRHNALRHDLPEFVAWALVYQAESGDRSGLAIARSLASTVANPTLRAHVSAHARRVDSRHDDNSFGGTGGST